MEDWVKLESFDRPHQAEIRKTILEQNNINAVVINAKDSLFLIGEYELYVRKEDEKMAHAIIEEFQGLTKVDSFILSKPLENLRDILIQKMQQSTLRAQQLRAVCSHRGYRPHNAIPHRRKTRRMEPAGNLRTHTSDKVPRRAA